MRTVLCCFLLFLSSLVLADSPPETPQQALNQYVAFLNQSVDVLVSRFQMLQTYQADVARYRQKSDWLLKLPSSGPLEEYYYQKAVAGKGLAGPEKQQLTASAQALWQRLTKVDETCKALETYVRLGDYQRDKLKQSDALISDLQALFSQFSRDRQAFFAQVQRIYRQHQPVQPTDPYLQTDREMEQVLLSQQQLLGELPFYLNEDSRSDWPVGRVQQCMLTDEQALAGFGKAEAAIGYPASGMVTAFRTAVRSIQAVKSRGVNEYTYAARQSARHGNQVYLSLLNYYNNDLLANHQSFVRYSQSARQLLDQPKYSPVFQVDSPAPVAPTMTQTRPFQDKPLSAFALKPATAPISNATFQALNGYVEFINESLRQMHQLQLLLRNYQSSAEYYRDPARGRQRADLTYAHDDYKVPGADYQLLLSASQHIPAAYRTAINSQAGVLLAMLAEMDGLSIELITYTKNKQYLQDQLHRSDEVLDRYAYLFDAFDQKKEQLYRDVRRIYESYPAANPSSAWNRAGGALLQTLDNDKAILFGVKAYLKSETGQLPPTAKLEVDARTLIATEYQNLKGLQRFGRSNGLCPYSPYEDLAENSLRLAQMAHKVKPAFVSSAQTQHPYESFYYFFNGQLVYEYNKFSELAKDPLLKAVNQPDVFAFRRIPPSNDQQSPKPAEPPVPNRPVRQPAETVSVNTSPKPESKPAVNVAEQTTRQRDTVYVERTKVDTVYVDRSSPREVANSLDGFAANNMVLLLDVSGSMDSPIKLPLLKRSIKSLLVLLRPEDQLSVVVYSGKARVVLKPTSGANAREIARVIDELASDGDTDGNEGIRLAYKLANKHYLRAGNNRIILATDGEFPVSDEVRELIGQNARQDVYLTVFTFGKNAHAGEGLRQLSQLGKGTFTHVTPENANLQLILEAQAKKAVMK